MFDIVYDSSEDIFSVFYSGTLLETFYSRTDAEDYIASVMSEYDSAFTFDEPWMVGLNA